MPRRYYERAHVVRGARARAARTGGASRGRPRRGVRVPRPPAAASEWLPSRRTWLADLGGGRRLPGTARRRPGRALDQNVTSACVASRRIGTGPALEIYRVTGDGSTRPADGWMSAGDELAFAYRNPTGFTRLMMFGVDDRGDIYWFHPAWTDATQDPVARADRRGRRTLRAAGGDPAPGRGAAGCASWLCSRTARLRCAPSRPRWRSARPDPAGGALRDVAARCGRDRRASGRLDAGDRAAGGRDVAAAAGRAVRCRRCRPGRWPWWWASIAARTRRSPRCATRTTTPFVIAICSRPWGRGR